MTVAAHAKSKSSTAPIVAWRQPVEREADETKRCNKSCIAICIYTYQDVYVYIYKTGKLLKVCACDMEDSPCFNVLLYVWVCFWRDQIIEGTWSMNMKGNPETLISQSSSPLGEVCAHSWVMGEYCWGPGEKKTPWPFTTCDANKTPYMMG